MVRERVRRRRYGERDGEREELLEREGYMEE